MIAILALGLGGWGAFAVIDGAVVSPGRIEVQNQRQIIQHLDGGVVADLLVREGDVVQAGQPILIFDGVSLRSELAMTEAQFYEVLARTGRLEAERDGLSAVNFGEELITRGAQDAAIAALMQGQLALFAARAKTLEGQREQLGERIAQIESLLGGFEEQIASLDRQQALIANEVRDKRSLLDRRLAQASSVNALDREAARLEGERGSLVARSAEARGRIIETRLEALNLGAQRREDAISELRDLGLQELQLTEKRIALAERISRLELRAPVGGVLYGLTVAGPQAVVRAAETLGYVVPQDRPLIVAARIAPKDINNVHPSQEARLRFTSFSSRATPEVLGQVSLVSADVFEDQSTRQSYFRAEVSIDPSELHKLGTAQLLPGMQVEVLLSTGGRPALSYLVKPITDYFVAAFRES